MLGDSSKSVFKGLLMTTVYEFTKKEIMELNDANLSDRHTIKSLPDYCIAGDKVELVDEIYSFINPDSLSEEESLKKELMFDLHPMTNTLQQEFDDLGILPIINDYIGKDFVKAIKEKCEKVVFADYRKRTPDESILVIDIIYSKSYDHYSGGCEYDVDFELSGYLDKQMILQTI